MITVKKMNILDSGAGVIGYSAETIFEPAEITVIIPYTRRIKCFCIEPVIKGEMVVGVI